MNLILNFPKDETALQEGVAIFKAILISRSIDNLNLESEDKQKIKEKLIKELERAWMELKMGRYLDRPKKKKKDYENSCNL